MFQFRRFPTYCYLIHSTLLEVCSSGLPHSDISGSMLSCSSPKLFAAYHVLHRLLMPRHSPCALFSLTFVGISIRTLRFRPQLTLWPKTPLSSAVPPLNSKPACAGLLICWETALLASAFQLQLLVEKSILVSLVRIMQAH